MIKLLKKISGNIIRRIKISRYDDFTIAEYFRELGAQIGEDNRLEVRNLGPEPYLVKIGNHCTIAQNVVFLVHDGATWIFTEEIPSLQKFGPIQILDNCFIGYNTILMGNVTIGPNSIVGAGSIVTRDIPPNVVAAGNPARIICTTEEYKKKVTQKWKEQEPAGYFRGIEMGVKYPPHYIQNIKTRDSRLLKEHLIDFFRKKDERPLKRVRRESR
jgi:acetyltransferase-like isoleucine patch superfamily enzyme